MPANKLVCGDTEFEITPAYRRGALALRAGVSYRFNPFRDGSRAHDDWNDGHVNEDAGEHLRFGIDVVSAKALGRTYEEDPATPRDASGNVDEAWHAAQAVKLTAMKSRISPSPVVRGR